MSHFALQPTGPAVKCDFRGCVLDAWHDGDHDFAQAKKAIAWNYDRHCVVCGVPFAVIGADKTFPAATCGSEHCLLHYARRFSFDVPLLCRCPQRPYPHELSVHVRTRVEKPGTYVVWSGLRADPFAEEVVEFDSSEMRWPWSLALSPRKEPSTERKMVA